MSRKITMGMGEGNRDGELGRGGDQITIGFGMQKGTVYREVLRITSEINKKLELESEIKQWQPIA